MEPYGHLDKIRDMSDRWQEVQRQIGMTQTYRNVGYKVSTNAQIIHPESVYALIHHIEETYGVFQDICTIDADEERLGWICVRFRDANQAILFKLALNEDGILSRYNQG